MNNYTGIVSTEATLLKGKPLLAQLFHWIRAIEDNVIKILNKIKKWFVLERVLEHHIP